MKKRCTVWADFGSRHFVLAQKLHCQRQWSLCSYTWILEILFSLSKISEQVVLSSPIELVTRAVSVGSEIHQGGCAMGV